MKQTLATIYRELLDGTLSQAAAMARIRALKQAEARPATPAGMSRPFASRLALPQWRPEVAPTGDADAMPERRHVLVCGLPRIEAADVATALPGSRCTRLADARPQATPADLGAEYADAVLACIGLLREMLRDRPQGHCLLQVAVADDVAGALLEGLAGLFETAALEHPLLAGQLIVVPADTDAATLAERLRVEGARPGTRLVRWTRDGREVRRWRFLDDDRDAGVVPCAYREHGVYLVTGGLGGLGRLVAADILASTTAARVVLVGRSAPADDVLLDGRLDALGHAGRVEYRQADIARADDVSRLLAGVLADLGRLDGIVHGAGLLRDEFLLRKRDDDVRDVLAPKVAGTLHLHEATRGIPLDFFVLCSSIASWAGNLGQADYAAANGFMDAFAVWRNARAAAGECAGRTLSIAWPHWRDGGMNVDAASMAKLEQRTGLRSLDTANGLAALHRCLSLDESRLMVMYGDPDGMRQALEGTAGAAGEARTPPAPAAAPRVAAAAPAASTGDRLAQTRTLLRDEFSAVLKIPAQRIETQAALEQYGIDSILAMDLTSQLEGRFGPLPKTLFFEYQSIDELAAYFVRAHAQTLDGVFAPPVAPAADAASAAPAPTPVAGC